MEIWKTIVGFDGRYQVSNLGRVRTVALRHNSGDGRLIPLAVPKIRKLVDGGDGYLFVNLSIKSNKCRVQRIHRLVAETFLGKPPSKLSVVNHLNGYKIDNRDSNLEWTTVKGNRDHAVRMGLAAVGERQGSAKLKVWQVVEILKIGRTKTLRDIAKQFGVHSSTIHAILSGRIWASTHSLTECGKQSQTSRHTTESYA